MTHLTVMAWCGLARVPPGRIPSLVRCCDGRLASMDTDVSAVGAGEKLPTCPECAMYADSARLIAESFTAPAGTAAPVPAR